MHCFTPRFRLSAACLALASQLLWTTGGGAQPVVAPIAAGAATSVVVAELTASLKSIINAIENSATGASFQLRSDVYLLLSELEHLAATTTEQVFGEVARERAESFNAISRTIREMEAAVKSGAQALDPLAKHISDTITRLPFTDRRPRITSVTPSFVLAPSAGAVVTVKAQGNFLRWGPARLAFGPVVCRTGTHIETQVEFHCPAAAFATRSGFARTVGELSVAEEKDWLDSVRELFGGDADKKHYSVAVTVIPPVLGSYIVQSEHKVPRRATRHGFAHNFGHLNDYCAGRVTRLETVGVHEARDGWRIDTGSIRITGSGSVRGGGSGGGHGPPVAATESGFRFQYWVDNSSSKIGVSPGCHGLPGPRDRRGRYYGTATWSQWRNEDQPVTTQLPAGNLLWGKAVALRLPHAKASYLLTVRQINNEEVKTSGAEVSKWFAIERDASGLQLIIKPRTVDEAFR